MRIATLAPWIAVAALVAGAANATEEQAAPAPGGAPAAAPTGSVERSAVTSTIVDREPQDALEEVASDLGKVFYFTEVLDMPGETLMHRWEHDGAVMAEVPFEIGGAHWRTYSSKDLDPGSLGRWTVSTVDASGRVLDARGFVVIEAAPEVAPPAAPTP
jgi:hypothetical protein